METIMSHLTVLVSKIDRRQLQLALMLVVLILLVIGAGAPAGAGSYLPGNGG